MGSSFTRLLVKLASFAFVGGRPFSASCSLAPLQIAENQSAKRHPHGLPCPAIIGQELSSPLLEELLVIVERLLWSCP